jgi:single-strand DNA-binding protein
VDGDMQFGLLECNLSKWKVVKNIEILNEVKATLDSTNQKGWMQKFSDLQKGDAHLQTFSDELLNEIKATTGEEDLMKNFSDRLNSLVPNCEVTHMAGKLGADPVYLSMQGGTQVSTVSLATTSVWKERASGVKKEKTGWHRVVFFGNMAEMVVKNLKKGMQIFVEGPLHTYTWVDKNGVEHHTTELIGQRLTIQTEGKNGEIILDPI